MQPTSPNNGSPKEISFQLKSGKGTKKIIFNSPKNAVANSRRNNNQNRVEMQSMPLSKHSSILGIQKHSANVENAWGNGSS